ncbi:hypothetical protein PUN28_018954 [Cardiocondyla obscurior]|uniref:Secreted protein n=1 Tax=Cardiocondyla obscurior TaxID=286306 RepID=A0AAW2EGQ0_9HYME
MREWHRTTDGLFSFFSLHGAFSSPCPLQSNFIAGRDADDGTTRAARRTRPSAYLLRAERSRWGRGGAHTKRETLLPRWREPRERPVLRMM